jgi:ABC-type glycerol-3-phosphate transport system substrate-binding protein
MSRSLACALLGCVTLLAACGSSNSGSTGGSCTTKDSCWFVSSPEDYNTRQICNATGATFSEDACPTAGYTRKCTQVTSETTR